MALHVVCIKRRHTKKKGCVEGDFTTVVWEHGPGAIDDKTGVVACSRCPSVGFRVYAEELRPGTIGLTTVG